jgi:hypothetical protein
VVTENIMRHGFAPETTPMYRAEFGVRESNNGKHARLTSSNGDRANS